VQGIGAALLLPGSLAAIADAFPGRAEQARALGLWAAVSALALPAGPLLGGLIVSDLGWRAVFWINPPVVAACLAGVLPPIRPSPRARSGQPFDRSGLALATVALASAVYAVIAAGDSAGPAALAAAAVAGASGAGFIAAERRATAPLVPLPVFANPAFRVANTASHRAPGRHRVRRGCLRRGRGLAGRPASLRDGAARAGRRLGRPLAPGDRRDRRDRRDRQGHQTSGYDGRRTRYQGRLVLVQWDSTSMSSIWLTCRGGVANVA
jgi:MFS family permease